MNRVEKENDDVRKVQDILVLDAMETVVQALECEYVVFVEQLAMKMKIIVQKGDNDGAWFSVSSGRCCLWHR